MLCKVESSLEQHIEGLRAQGDLQSEGFFTLNLRSRERKTLDFYQEQSSFWQCKAVQLAISQGAHKIELSCTNSGTSLSAFGVRPIEYPFPEGSPMTTIVRGCLAQPEEVFELSCGGESSWGLRISKAGEISTDESLPAGEDLFVIRSVREKGSFWESLFKRARRNAQEAHELALRCQHAPIPVRLDGRSLLTARPFGFRPLAVLEVAYTNKLFDSAWRGVSFSKATQRFTQASLEYQALIGLPDLPGGPSTIYVMKDGLLLHAYRLDLGFRGTEVVLDCPDFKTDASTLQVVVDDCFRSVVESLRVRISHHANEAFRRCCADRTLDRASLRAIRQELGLDPASEGLS